MVVKPQCNGHRITGIYIGVSNVRRYFPRRVEAIDLQLDHLRIQCGLTERFWEGDPEIRDPRLSDWLELKQLQGAGDRNSMPLAMTPLGENSFILVPASPEQHAQNKSAAVPLHAEASQPVAPLARPRLAGSAQSATAA